MTQTASATPLEHHHITRGAGVSALFTVISRIFGLVRDLMIAHLFGASSVSDAFFLAFTIPNTMRNLVAEGAFTVSFIPLYAELQEKEGQQQALRFYRQAFGALLLLLILLCGLGMWGAKPLVYLFGSGFALEPDKFELAILLTRFMFPYLFFVSLVALSMGILNSHHHFAAPSASPTFLNVAMIICMGLGFSRFEEPIYGAAFGVLIGGVLQLLSQVPVLYHHGLLVWPSFQFRNSALWRLGRLMLPGLFGVAVYQLNLVILRQIGSYLPSGQLTCYYNADRLMQFTLGVFVVSIASATLPSLSRQLQKGSIRALIDTWNFSVRLTTYITIPAALGLMAVATPIVSLLFFHGAYSQEDTLLTAYTTMAFAPGLICIAVSRTTVQAFYALADMRSPVVAAFVSACTNLAFGLLLMRYQVVGLGLAFSLSCFVQMGLLVWMLRTKVGRLGSKAVLWGMGTQGGMALCAVAIAYGVSTFGNWNLGPTVANAAVLLISISLAVVVYIVLSWLYKSQELNAVLHTLGIR